MPLASETMLELYGTDKPTKDMAVRNMDFFNEIKRGQGIFLIVYSGDKPSEILFAGYSYD